MTAHRRPRVCSPFPTDLAGPHRADPGLLALIVDEDTTASGIVLFVVVVATDWVDGTIACRTGQVTELGKVLDPVADRVAIAAGLVALVVRGVPPGRRR